MGKALTEQKGGGAEDARARIKRIALKLFSERGIDGVSVRDIVSAAEMRNGASLHYYFGSKDALVKELLLDCAKQSDDARLEHLAKLEQDGGPHCLTDIVRLLIKSEVSLDLDAARRQDGLTGHTRFIMALQINHRGLMTETFASGELTVGYVKCVDYIRRFLAHLPSDVLQGRLILMYIYIISTLAAREAYLETYGADNGFWNAPEVVDSIVETTCGLLNAPVITGSTADGDTPSAPVMAPLKCD